MAQDAPRANGAGTGSAGRETSRAPRNSFGSFGVALVDIRLENEGAVKTRTVKFSFGTVKDASLQVPAEACSINDIAVLIRKSYLEYTFRPGCGLMSDECVTSSIGQANFFAGALGGYETRLSAADFALLKDCAENDIALACDVVRFRAEKQGRQMTQQQVYREASKNEALSEKTRAALAQLSTLAPV